MKPDLPIDTQILWLAAEPSVAPEAEERDCQGCGRIMSMREYIEQRLCDDCYEPRSR